MPYIVIAYSNNTQKVNTYRCGISCQNPFEEQKLLVTDASLVSINIFQEKHLQDIQKQDVFISY